MLKSNQKTFVSTTFIIANSDEAETISRTPPAALSGKYKLLKLRNVDDAMLSWLYTFLADRAYDPDFIAEQRLTASAQDGPWLFLVPPDLLQLMGKLTKPDLTELAKQCTEMPLPEFESWNSKALVDMLSQLSEFSKQSLAEKKDVILVVDVTSANAEQALDYKVRQLGLIGDDHLENDRFEKALETYQAAWDLLPDPAEECTAAPSILTSMGNAKFHLGNFQEAITDLSRALELADQSDAPFLLLRLGQCFYECGDHEQAAEELSIACIAAGTILFENDDPKYLEFLLSNRSELARAQKSKWNDASIRLELALEEFPEALSNRIRKLCIEANRLSAKGNYPPALEKLWTAFDLVHEPKDEHLTATWIITLIGDVNYLSKDFEAGRDNLSTGMNLPGALGNPFSHLRLGQCEFEMGDMARAGDELARAYISGGTEIFESENPKYLQFLSSILKPPAGQDQL